MVAVNPVNFGKPMKLTWPATLDRPFALARCPGSAIRALYITGLKEEAEQVFEGFSWGPHFLEVNEEVLD
eukprot:gene5789-4737_t